MNEGGHCDSELAAACAWDACKGLWQRSDIPAVYAALERCPWDAELAPLVAELRGNVCVRARAPSLLSVRGAI